MGNLGFRIGIGGLGEASPSACFFNAPVQTSSRSAANAWLRLRSFDLPVLVFSTDQNLSGRRAAASWRGGAPARMRAVMREAVLSGVRQVGHIVYHCAGERGAGCGSKVLGRCERGKGRRQARLWQSTRWWAERRRGRLRGADAAEVGHAKGLKVARLQARQMFGPISFSVAGVLSAYVFCLVSCLTQRALVASYCIPPPAATGGHIHGRGYFRFALLHRVGACHGALLGLLLVGGPQESQIGKVVRRKRLGRCSK